MTQAIPALLMPLVLSSASPRGLAGPPLQQLLAAGLQIELSLVEPGFISAGGRALLVKLRAPLDRIEAHADIINMKVGAWRRRV